jgi:hypothetical protein
VRSRLTAPAFVVTLLLLGSRVSRAQTLSVSGNPGALQVTTAVAGSQPTAVSNAATTYTVTTPNANKTYRITAQLNANMPAGVTLTLTLAAPPSATSAGAVTLTTAAQNVVTGIPKNTNATRAITYQLTGNTSAGVIASTNRLVTLTLVTP